MGLSDRVRRLEDKAGQLDGVAQIPTLTPDEDGTLRDQDGNSYGPYQPPAERPTDLWTRTGSGPVRRIVVHPVDAG